MHKGTVSTDIVAGRGTLEFDSDGGAWCGGGDRYIS